jgi:uncharacterized membrane protein YedE/YeeE
VNRTHLARAAALVGGIFFGVGLVVSGMTLPSKVAGFLDFTGAWDPTLMFVMGGAIAVHALVYWLVRKRPSPLFAERFQLPTRKDIDARLVLGAAIFGVGWGLGGYCPGPAVTSIVSGHLEIVAFVVAMLGAMWAVGQLEARASAVKSEPARQRTATPAPAREER